MKNDSLNSRAQADPHERARQMIALFGLEKHAAELSSPEQLWLDTHLESCERCREYEENSRASIRALRGVSIAASGKLVSRTQMLVRQRAAQLQRQQERLWMICACCAAVTFSTAVTTAALWRGFEWIGQEARLAAPIWESGFAVFWLMPAVLVGIFLLSRGTFLADSHDSYYEDCNR